MQIIQIAVAIVVLALLVWLAFYLFIAAVVIGAGLAVFIAIRRFLIDKGIVLDKRSQNRPASNDSMTIETSYSEITESSSKRDV